MHDPRRESTYYIKGDAPDPSGMSALRGVEHGLKANAIGHPKIRYRDRISEADVYASDGQLLIVLICPKCENTLQIQSSKKDIRYEASEQLLSTERIACTYDCDWRVTIDRNVAIDVDPFSLLRRMLKKMRR